jgi:hypothetical protein
MADNNAVFSSMVRAGRTTYFIDVKEARTGKKYLSITETTLTPNEKRDRSVIRIFPEAIECFNQAVNEAVNAART